MNVGSYSNSGLGFGVAFQLRDEFSNTAQQIQNSMRALGGSTDALQTGINSAMNQMGIGVGFLAVGLAGLAPFIKGAQIQAEFESAEIGLTTLLGSAEKASTVFEQIKQQAAATPFDTKSLLSANQAIISQGIDAQRSMGLVMNLGDALSAMGRGSEDLQAMSINLQQIAANGHATALDLRQFAMRGINISALISDITGKTQEEISKAPVTFAMIEQAFKHASMEGGKYAGAMERMSHSVAGEMSTLKDNVSFSLAALGEAIQPITHMLIRSMITLMDKVKDFAKSPLGSVITKMAFAFSVLSVAIGITLIATGALKMAMYQLSSAFSGATRAAIIQAMANGGLTAAFGALATAVWSAMAPLIPYVLVIAAVAAEIYAVYYVISESIAAFNDYNASVESAGTGLHGFMQRLGGFLTVIQEVWDTWNGVTFALKNDTEWKLQRLGIYDTAVALATWVLRIKEFFSAAWGSITTGASVIWDTITTVFNAVAGVINSVFDAIGINIGKNLSSLKEWAFYGKIAGYAILALLGLVAFAFLNIAIVQTLVFLPVIASIGIIIFLVSKLREKFSSMSPTMKFLGEGVDKLIDVFGDLFTLIGRGYNVTSTILVGIFEIGYKLFEVISSWVIPAFNSLIEILSEAFTPILHGILSIFGILGAQVMAWITPILSVLSSVWEYIQSITKEMGVVGTIGNYFGIASDFVGSTVNHVVSGLDSMKNPAYSPATGSGVGVTAMSNAGAFNASMTPQRSTQPTATGGDTPIHVNLMLDGDVLSTKMIERSTLNDSRR